MSSPEQIRLALLGDPVGHSRSPAIHAAALRLAGLVGGYEAITARQPDLDHHLERLRRGELSGVNVTMPLKVAALDRSERSTQEARGAGSANTLRASGGAIEAHSTDVLAFVDIFAELDHGGPMLILGAGGSAGAALAARGGMTAFVSARDMSRAAEVGGDGTVPWGEPVPGALVVNATPLGMRGERLPDGVLEQAAVLVDLPYGREETPAVGEAGARGLPTVDGVEFLTRQAAHSFEWWTGVAVEWTALLDAARKV